MIKKVLSRLYYKYLWNSALGQRIRQKKGEALSEVRPFQSKASISDLFVWRVDENWSTDFQLFNISSFLYPEEKPSEVCDVFIFDDQGNILKKITLTLQAFEMKTLRIRDLIHQKGMGCFSIFHYSSVIKKIANHNSHLTERGYAAYSRKGDELKSFCHGNLQALSKTTQTNHKQVVGTSLETSHYYPQLTFSDCDEFELIFTNPTFSKKNVLVECYDYKNNFLRKVDADIPAMGCHVFRINNQDKHIHTIKNSGHIVMWRPVIFKNYQTHFDVMHG